MCVCVCVCMYVCMYVCVCVCMCVCPDLPVLQQSECVVVGSPQQEAEGVQVCFHGGVLEWRPARLALYARVAATFHQVAHHVQTAGLGSTVQRRPASLHRRGDGLAQILVSLELH